MKFYETFYLINSLLCLVFEKILFLGCFPLWCRRLQRIIKSCSQRSRSSSFPRERNYLWSKFWHWWKGSDGKWFLSFFSCWLKSHSEMKSLDNFDGKNESKESIHLENHFNAFLLTKQPWVCEWDFGEINNSKYFFPLSSLVKGIGPKLCSSNRQGQGHESWIRHHHRWPQHRCWVCHGCRCGAWETRHLRKQNLFLSQGTGALKTDYFPDKTFLTIRYFDIQWIKFVLWTGISVEVINLRSIRPLDMDTINESIKKTSNTENIFFYCSNQIKSEIFWCHRNLKIFWILKF